MNQIIDHNTAADLRKIARVLTVLDLSTLDPDLDKNLPGLNARQHRLFEELLQNPFAVGDRVTDELTGRTGIVTAVTQRGNFRVDADQKVRVEFGQNAFEWSIIQANQLAFAPVDGSEDDGGPKEAPAIALPALNSYDDGKSAKQAGDNGNERTGRKWSFPAPALGGKVTVEEVKRHPLAEDDVKRLCAGIASAKTIDEVHEAIASALGVDRRHIANDTHPLETILAALAGKFGRVIR